MNVRRRVIIAISLLVVASLACSLSASERSATQVPTRPGNRSEGARAAPTPTVYVPPAPASPSATPVSEQLIIEADAEESLLINIYERASPAVVNIEVVLSDTEFGFSELAGGSGFVIDTQGHIVTNNHVVEEAESIVVTFSNGLVVDAQLVAADEDSDLAVIRIDTLPEGLAPLELGSSKGLRVGQRVIAIGSPWELQGTMTAGIISALGRTLESRLTEDGGYYSIPDIIQTDAAINPGNSGGPLLDSHGRVVGVNSAIRSEGRYNSGVGFAIPVDIVKRIVPALIQQGYYPYPYLGISSNDQISVAELAREIDMPVNRGVLIASVVPGGPAEQAGLRGSQEQIEVLGQPVYVGGDIILAIEGTALHNFDDLIAYLVRETEVGQEVRLTIARGDETLEIPLTLGERP